MYKAYTSTQLSDYTSIIPQAAATVHVHMHDTHTHSRAYNAEVPILDGQIVVWILFALQQYHTHTAHKDNEASCTQGGKQTR